LPDPVPQVPFATARLGHLLPEVFSVKDKAVEEEPRDHLGTAGPALVAPDAKYQVAAAGRAPVEGQGGIKFMAAGLASALSFPEHLKAAAPAPGTRAACQHHRIVEPPGLLAEGRDSGQEPEGQPDDVHGWPG